VLTSPATFDLEPQTLAQRSRWFSDHGRSYPLIVAERQGRVLGYASLSEFRDKPGYSKSAEDSVYVHRNFQGQGVGKALMKEILARAVNLGYHTIIAAIVPPNEASVRLHEGLEDDQREAGRRNWRWKESVPG